MAGEDEPHALGVQLARLPHVGTVQDAIRHDMAHGLTFGENRNRKGVSFNVLWLSRALRFILFLLENMTDGAFAGKETKDAAREAYSRSIKPFHGMLLSNVFGTMMGQVPSRKKFIENLAEGRTAEEAYHEMAAFARIAGPMVADLHDFLSQNGLDHPWKA